MGSEQTTFGFHFPSAVGRQTPGTVDLCVLYLFPVLFARLGFKRGVFDPCMYVYAPPHVAQRFAVPLHVAAGRASCAARPRSERVNWDFCECQSVSQMRSGWENKPWFKKCLFSFFPPLPSLPPPLTSRSLALTLFNFPRLHGFKASVHLGYVPSFWMLRHHAILGVEQRV